jgi:selenocysteine lyase/cysteine desulfurase
LTTFLWSKHRIIATPIKHAEFQGLRVTPNVYTTLDDIDRFMSAIDEVLAHGVPTAD